jgi:hypothetical protein
MNAVDIVTICPLSTHYTRYCIPQKYSACNKVYSFHVTCLPLRVKILLGECWVYKNKNIFQEILINHKEKQTGRDEKIKGKNKIKI